MKKIRGNIGKGLVFGAALMAGAGWSVGVASAAEKVLKGGIAIGQDYDSNIDRSYTGRETEWTTSITPSMALEVTEARSSYSLSYAPKVVYSHRTDNERLDHTLSGRLENKWLENLATYMNETFIKAEDPYEDEEANIQLSDQLGRNRYWTNSFLTGLDYEYAKDSFLKLSYLNHVLDNSEPGREDFVKHTPKVSLSHRFDHQWQTLAEYSYTKGDYDQSDDLKQNVVDLYAYYSWTTMDKSFCHYSYSDSSYDGTKEGYDIQSLSVGHEKQYSKTLSFNAEGGGTLVDRDGQSGTSDEFYFRAGLNKTEQKWNLQATAEGGFDEKQFTGATDEGLSRYWMVKASYDHRVLQDLLATLGCSYRKDTYLERTPEEDEEEFRAEGGLVYSFGQWYEASVKYIYTNMDADDIAKKYDDHRLFFQLSVKQDLLKW